MSPGKRGGTPGETFVFLPEGTHSSIEQHKLRRGTQSTGRTMCKRVLRGPPSLKTTGSQHLIHSTFQKAALPTRRQGVFPKASPRVVQIDDWEVEEMLLLPASPVVPPAVDGHKQHLQGTKHGCAQNNPGIALSRLAPRKPWECPLSCMPSTPSQMLLLLLGRWERAMPGGKVYKPVW